MIVILNNIRSLHNVGSIFRTADAVGAEKIYLCGITPAPTDLLGNPREQLTKASLGAEKFVPWDASASSSRAIKKLLEKLKKDKYKIFAIEQSKNSVPYYSLQNKINPKKIAFVLGNEVKGLPPAILKIADKILEIPMLGRKESLNVAVSFGIVVFHIKFAGRKGGL